MNAPPSGGATVMALSSKGVKSRLGKLEVKIPQVRDLKDFEDNFYPKSLDKGLRSERALKVAVAKMYIKGVSTRKIKDITRKLCGLDVSSTEFSRASKMLDEELEKWRSQPLREIPYLQLDARYEKVRQKESDGS